MKQIYHTPGIASLGYLAIIMLSVGLVAGNVWGDVSGGLKLDLYADEVNYPELRFTLGQDPIQITMVVKNDTPWSIYTDRGFSPAGLHRALILTDPNGVKHAYSEEGDGAFDVLPGISWNQISTTEAQILGSNWIRSVIIEDFRSLFPMLNTIPGWYVIEAQQPFIRFAWAVNVHPLGLLAPQQDPNNWYGTIDSNRIQIYVEPPYGAQLQAQVLNDTVQPSQTIAQVPLRVFKKDDIRPRVRHRRPGRKPHRFWRGPPIPGVGRFGMRSPMSSVCRKPSMWSWRTILTNSRKFPLTWKPAPVGNRAAMVPFPKSWFSVQGVKSRHRRLPGIWMGMEMSIEMILQQSGLFSINRRMPARNAISTRTVLFQLEIFVSWCLCAPDLDVLLNNANSITVLKEVTL